MSEHEASIVAAHQLITELADVVLTLHKRIEDLNQRLGQGVEQHTNHRARLAGHDQRIAEHSKMHDEHEQRLSRLERAGGKIPTNTHPIYALTADQQGEMSKRFRRTMRA